MRTYTTEIIERGNRLLSLRQSAGYNELVRLFEARIYEAQKARDEFPGWDQQQYFALGQRVKAALELKDAILSDIDQGIQQGHQAQLDRIAESPEIPFSERAAVVAADELREAAIAKGERDGLLEPLAESRVSGSY